MSMEATELTFGARDVITIIIGAITIVGFYYALRRSIERLSGEFRNLETKQKEDHSTVMAAMKEHKDDLDKRELKIYEQIDHIRSEQKEAHIKLESKMDSISTEVNKISSNLSELTGYIKAKKESEK